MQGNLSTSQGIPSLLCRISSSGFFLHDTEYLVVLSSRSVWSWGSIGCRVSWWSLDDGTDLFRLEHPFCWWAMVRGLWVNGFRRLAWTWDLYFRQSYQTPEGSISCEDFIEEKMCNFSGFLTLHVHLEYESIVNNICFFPIADFGRGPRMSTWSLANASSIGMGTIGARDGWVGRLVFICLDVFVNILMHTWPGVLLK